jgi:8-oxo-dGTP pyrophosphatase MutT (NUDIX family)
VNTHNPTGQSADRGAGQGSDGGRSTQAQKKSQASRNPQGGQNQRTGQSGQSGQSDRTGHPAQSGKPTQTGEGQARQGRRRRRGGRGRRGGQGRTTEAQRQNPGTDGGAPTQATQTVRSGDGTAGATSARQSPRHPRNQNRSRSSSGQAASAGTTRAAASAKSGAGSGSGAKNAAKSGTKPGGKSGAKGSGNKTPRGGRGGSRHPRNGQRLRTVLETSAGGLVVRGLAQAAGGGSAPDLSGLEVALIGRLDRRGRMLWSMPKGHIEPGETVEETARREVLEETGVDGTVLAPLGTIDYWFVAEGRRIHKTVHHHLIRYDHGDLCDEDPEITEVAWVAFDQLPKRLAYPDERRLVEAARTLLPDLARAEKAGESPVPQNSQVVDPSRRSGGPEPIRRSTGGAPSSGPRRDPARGDGPEESRP